MQNLILLEKEIIWTCSPYTWSCESGVPYESLSLKNREIFKTTVHTPKGVKSVGYEWLFVWKQNEDLEFMNVKFI